MQLHFNSYICVNCQLYYIINKNSGDRLGLEIMESREELKGDVKKS